MKFNVTTILVILILLLIGAGFIGYNIMDNKVEDANDKIRNTTIAADSLRLENGIYKKLVADTLEIKELKELVKELQIKVENPIIVERIVVKPADTVKDIDSIYINEGKAIITDFYPNKDNYFVRYQNEFTLENPKGKSEWKFNELPIDIVIGEKEDGTFEANLKAPDFIKVGKLDVSGIRIKPDKVDNFGVLLGAGYGKDFGTGTDYLEVGGGMRFKKTYLILEGNTNKQADIGLKFEF